MMDAFHTSGTSPTSETGPDFRCENHGSIFLLYPLSPSAQAWTKEYLPEDLQHFGDAIVLEHRFIWAILEGIQNDGLAVARG
jgi:hypothetical protein